MAPVAAHPTQKIYIEFDEQQLTVATDVPEVVALLEQTYSAMLVPRSITSLGQLDFLRTAEGFVMRGLREFDYAAPLAYLFDSIKDEVLRHFVASRQDLMWIHAGAVEWGGKALVFAGPSGNGKSTIVTRLCERGCRFLSDDIAPIRMTANEILPFPQTPRRRVHPRFELPPDAIALLDREVVAIEPDRVRRGAVEIGVIVFPLYMSGAAADLNRVPPADAAFKLIRDCTNFVDHKAAAVSRAVEMARTIPVYKLVYSDGPAAVSALKSLR